MSYSVFYFISNDCQFKGKDLTKNLNVLIERVLCWLPAPIAGHGVPPFQECGLTILGPWADQKREPLWMKTAFPIRPRPGGEDAMGLGSDVGSALIGAWKKNMFCNSEMCLDRLA